MSEIALAGVMGWPIAHSKSPLLHGHWLKRYHVNGYYVPMAVPPERLGQALRALPALGFAGCNLTVPHKEAALDYLDEIDEHARRIGSVNTVVVRKDGKLTGRSTDGYGFLENVRRQAPNWTPGAGIAVILGAGGSARAIAAALADEGVSEIRIVNRSPERSEKLVRDIGSPLSWMPWEKRTQGLSECRLLVNTTTQGMTGQPALEIDLEGLAHTAIVADIVYAPLETPLLRDAKDRGLAAVDGLGMLLHQARPGFASWFGVEPEVDDSLRQAVLQTSSG